MLGVYRLCLYLFLPIVFVRLAIKAIRYRQYRNRLPQRFGFGINSTAANGIWIHAVSVGEVNAASPLVTFLLNTYPDVALTVTTMTPTGADRVKQLYADKVTHCYLPYDYPGAVTRFVKSTKPMLAMIMETEIWPNMIHACHENGVPMMYTNVRLSQRSYVGYRRFKALIGPTLEKVDEFAVQSRADADRLIDLGARPDSVYVSGNLKFDMAIPPSIEESGLAIRRILGNDRSIWVAGSTHEGEEEQVIDAFSQAKRQMPDLLLLLVPRHPERFSSVAKLCDRSGFHCVHRSESRYRLDENADIYLVDTMGELTLFLCASDVAFIGGSLVPTGGHNLLEANALGVPVVFGPHMFNFSDVSKMVLEKGAGRQVENSDELGVVIVELLNDPALRDRCGENGRALIAQNKGALEQIKQRVQTRMSTLRGG